MSPLRPALLGICAETHLQELLVPFPVYHLTDQFLQMWALCSFAPVFLTRGTLHVWVPPTPHKLLTLKALTVVSSLIITCTSGTFPAWSHRERLSCATANSSWARNTGVKNLDRWSLSGFFFPLIIELKITLSQGQFCTYIWETLSTLLFFHSFIIYVLCGSIKDLCSSP